MPSQFIRSAILFILLALFHLPSFGEGYEINLQIHGVSDTNIILGHYINKSMYPDDTTYVDSKGFARFEGESALDQGMYVVFIPTGKFFQLLIAADQFFELETDTANFVDNAMVKGSADNEIFFEFQQYMISKQKEINAFQDALKRANTAAEKEEISDQIKDLSAERKQKINKIVIDNPNLFVSTFLLATLDIEVPAPIKKADGSIDSTWQYRYYRAHYFDNFNPADARLLRTPLYEDKVMYYLEKVVPQIPDTLIVEVDILLDESKVDSSLFRYLLITLFNYYGKSKIMGMDAVQVHIAEKYYLTDTWWNDEKFLTDLADRVNTLKPLLIGNPAPNVELMEVPREHFIAAANDSALKAYPHAGQLKKLSSYQSEFIVLMFWEATCSHCKTSVPEMYTIYKDELEGSGVEVISISTLFGEEGKVKWIDFINKNELYDWVNAWNPYDYKFKVEYDIRSTPQIFILNKNKEIIGKRLGAEQVAGYIKAYRQQFSDEY